uniref:Uncharacterized protein n=1 Tax=Anguilla anguilla TaxID=7936 RepID=A0A0E9TJF3_ANGAN
MVHAPETWKAQGKKHLHNMKTDIYVHVSVNPCYKINLFL